MDYIPIALLWRCFPYSNSSTAFVWSLRAVSKRWDDTVRTHIHRILSELRLEGLPISDGTLRQFMAAVGCGVQHVELAQCLRLSDAGIASVLAACHSLRFLSLAGCGVGVRFAEIAPSLASRLTHLDISECSRLESSHVVPWASSLKALRALHARHCRGITDEFVSALACAAGEVLEILDVSGCEISDTSMVLLSSHMRSLHTLSVAWCGNITESGLSRLPKLHSSLTSLSLNAVASINDRTLNWVARGCSRLVALDASQCTALSDGALASVAKYCSSLTDLRVAQCCKITDRGVVLLSTRCVALTSLDLRGTAVTDGGAVDLSLTNSALRFSRIQLG